MRYFLIFCSSILLFSCDVGGDQVQVNDFEHIYVCEDSALGKFHYLKLVALETDSFTLEGKIGFRNSSGVISKGTVTQEDSSYVYSFIDTAFNVECYIKVEFFDDFDGLVLMPLDTSGYCGFGLGARVLPTDSYFVREPNLELQKAFLE